MNRKTELIACGFIAVLFALTASAARAETDDDNRIWLNLNAQGKLLSARLIGTPSCNLAGAKMVETSISYYSDPQCFTTFRNEPACGSVTPTHRRVPLDQAQRKSIGSGNNFPTRLSLVRPHCRVGPGLSSVRWIRGTTSGTGYVKCFE